ncbi:hypothetical protein Ddc_18990 [Ditylenchus destructor]|nr:hypothetical protein Ddc_18990 [Ditylenchus destructor]
MSNSKHLPPFTFDVLCCLNRDQLERCSIVSRLLKNIIQRYFHSKPYRVFCELKIRGGSYALVHKSEQWHPNRDGYSAQQFLAGEIFSIDKSKRSSDDFTFYTFAEMRPYLGLTVRIDSVDISVAGQSDYSTKHITEMESIAYLWRDGKISIANADELHIQYQLSNRLRAEDFQLILNSPTILQCQTLHMGNAHFSYKDYKVLYTVNVICFDYADEKIDPDCWPQFLEQRGVKPVIVLRQIHHENVDSVLDRLTEGFLEKN